jgi:2-methylcitrate dehydratase
MRRRIPDLEAIQSITLYTSHHTHSVIGTGAGDPQKLSPDATRETLDHSIMYILAVALEDGVWHHVKSYASERAHRPSTVRLWHKIATAEDRVWTERYHHPDPNQRAFGGRLEIHMQNGEVLTDELAVADAHPAGARPFARADYVAKFRTLTEELVSETEAQRFLDLAQNVGALDARALAELTVRLDPKALVDAGANRKGIF